MATYGSLLAEEDREGASSMALDVTLLVNFSTLGFRSTPRFRKSWAKLSAAGRIGNTRQFGKLFCKSDHFQVIRTVNSKRIVNNVVVVWGYPMVYSLGSGGKPLLGAIAPKGWHLTQVGRSVLPPALCRTRKP
jgi:hypothetical protein